MKELKRLGESYSESLKTARELITARFLLLYSYDFCHQGPNPLSCKKKKSLGLSTFVSKSESNDGSETIRSTSNKKRKRSRKGKKLEATNG
ncbi:hypothetical protein RHGRI_028466 [Rhododendron griersonianum]|uniref:UTP23 sensor motif region domain-containing protein n=1 Tax=Rhododendron griersonianum TaxID=479676 RepID=A0AAV6IFX6_9ERIC|nr:hypothetical protein RHGRI_028466 [Rhododendron griersonianum]